MSRAKNLANFQTTITDGTTSVATSTAVDAVKNGSAKVWAQFNGTGTPALANSHNVSSITDKASGNYGLNITSSMSDANYPWSCAVGQESNAAAVYALNRYGNAQLADLTASVLPMWTGAPTGTSGLDYQDACAIAFGDLA